MSIEIGIKDSGITTGIRCSLTGAKGVTPVEMEFSYDSGVLRVVVKRPFSLGWSASIKPIQAWQFDQGLATLASMVATKDRWTTNS